MHRFFAIGLCVCASAAALATFVWVSADEPQHFTADELIKLTCHALGQRHEEVIFDYHDAEIAHYRRTGAFHDDLGLPSEDVVPYAVLIKRFMQDNHITVADLATTSSSTPLLDSDFYYETSAICAANPSWQAVDAMRQAAINLGLIDGQADQ